MSFQRALEVKLLSTLGAAALAVATLLIFSAPIDALASQRDDEVPTIENKTRGMIRFAGFFDLYFDESDGKLYWEIDRWDTEFLYQVSLASGLGSNPVGLDRGQLGGTYVLEARRVGPTVLLIEPNYGYRARSDNPYEVQAVEDAFASSTHLGPTSSCATHTVSCGELRGHGRGPSSSIAVAASSICLAPARSRRTRRSRHR